MMNEPGDYMEKARRLVEQALTEVESPESKNSDVMALALLAIAVALIGLGKEDQGSR